MEGDGVPAKGGILASVLNQKAKVSSLIKNFSGSITGTLWGLKSYVTSRGGRLGEVHSGANTQMDNFSEEKVKGRVGPEEGEKEVLLVAPEEGEKEVVPVAPEEADKVVVQVAREEGEKVMGQVAPKGVKVPLEEGDKVVVPVAPEEGEKVVGQVASKEFKVPPNVGEKVVVQAAPEKEKMVVRMAPEEGEKVMGLVAPEEAEKVMGLVASKEVQVPPNEGEKVVVQAAPEKGEKMVVRRVPEEGEKVVDPVALENGEKVVVPVAPEKGDKVVVQVAPVEGEEVMGQVAPKEVQVPPGKGEKVVVPVAPEKGDKVVVQVAPVEGEEVMGQVAPKEVPVPPGEGDKVVVLVAPEEGDKVMGQVAFMEVQVPPDEGGKVVVQAAPEEGEKVVVPPAPVAAKKSILLRVWNKIYEASTWVKAKMKSALKRFSESMTNTHLGLRSFVTSCPEKLREVVSGINTQIDNLSEKKLVEVQEVPEEGSLLHEMKMLVQKVRKLVDQWFGADSSPEMKVLGLKLKWFLDLVLRCIELLKQPAGLIIVLFHGYNIYCRSNKAGGAEFVSEHEAEVSRALGTLATLIFSSSRPEWLGFGVWGQR